MNVSWKVVVDDGTRPYAPDVLVDQRRPLSLIVGEDSVIDVLLINPVGGVVLLAPGGADFLVLDARTLCQPTRPLFNKRSAAIADQRYRITIAADDTKNMVAQRGGFDLWVVRGSTRTCLIPLSELLLAPSALGKNYL